MDSRAIFRLYMGFCIRTVLWALLESLYRTRVLLAYQKYRPQLMYRDYLAAMVESQAAHGAVLRFRVRRVRT